ncbi:unnamed protein product, partial [Ectocarpus sp. 12 AP-2014]
MLPVQPSARPATWPGTSLLRRRLRLPAPLIPSLLWGTATRMFDTLSILLPRHSDGEDEKEGKDVDDGGLIGTVRTAGKLQVVVSGPSEFVVHARQLLAE